MNRNQLFESMESIDDSVLERSEKRKNRQRKPWWIGAVAAVLVVAVSVGIALRPGVQVWQSSSTSYDATTLHTAAIKTAVYPEMAPYPEESDFEDSATGDVDWDSYSEASDAWRESIGAQRQEEGYADGLNGFFQKSIPVFLKGEDGENRIYSPLNVYMALGMLAELTGGNTRQQILDLVGSADIESLRSQAHAVWNGQYMDDGATATVLASSLWLRDDINYVDSTMETLADNYYASSFQGEMGSDELNQALRDWLNEQTGGLLEDQIGELFLYPDTVLALATTLYFQACWSDKFSEGSTSPQTFHGPDGDQTVEFMHSGNTQKYYQGENFTATSCYLENSGNMWFFLPEEGMSPEALLEDPQAMEFLLTNGGEGEEAQYPIVNLSLPKFDVSSQTDLLEGLKTLGVTDAMDSSISDFTPTTQDVSEIFLSQAQHDVRVAIDEEGVTAAAYTVMQECGSSAEEPEEVDFVLDRPFLFAILSQDGLPLFVGIVNQPQES